MKLAAAPVIRKHGRGNPRLRWMRDPVNTGRVGHGEEADPATPIIALATQEEEPLLHNDYDDEEKPLTIDTSFDNGDADNDDVGQTSPPADFTSTSGVSPPLPSNNSSISRPESVNDLHSMSGSPPLGSARPQSPTIPSTMSGSSMFQSPNFVFPTNESVSRTFKRGAKISEEFKILPVAGKDGETRFICPVCQDEMSNLHELTVHIRQHNATAISSTVANKCTICNKILSSQSSLDRHMLVHSGERPFACRICKMSFTTNGNMHRHTRIHSKEADISLGAGGKTGSRRGKGGWRPKPPLVHDLDPSITDSAASRFLSEPPTTFTFRPLQPVVDLQQYSPGKRPFPDGERWDRGLPAKKTMISPPVHAVPIHHTPSNTSVALPETPPVLPATLNGEYHAPDSGRLKEEEHFICPLCSKVLLSHSGLEAHLESHPNTPVKCSLCSKTLQNPRALTYHKIIEHPSIAPTTTTNNDGPSDPNAPATGEDEPEVTDGFHDLTFVDFTSLKFPLIAKAACEHHARTPSSMYHEFVCKSCNKAFPCKSALLMHIPIHTGKQLTSCPFCDCEFVDQDIMQTHMVKHMSERVIEEAHATEARSVSQQDFLAVFDLAPRQLVRGRESQTKKTMKIEKRENNEYFAKLGHAYSPHPSPDVTARVAKEVEDLKRFFPQVASTLFIPERFPYPLGSLGLAGIPQQLCQSFLALPQQPHSHLHSPASSRSLTPPLTGHVKQSGSPFQDSIPISTPPLWEEGQSDAEVKVVFPCKYCDVVFTNQRSLKGHTRTHLGLSPYKCNLCEYSSADKSTLIRHLRTHNGERPFQCLICDFAFTTKANCERHVRKKHNKVMKDDIEMSIGYNKFVMDTSTNMEAFHSPDTICKYCGVDFKFFRALKHHLRSHSSCRQKPFLCQRCNVGFSTKANCVRHIQKQHLEVSQNQIESMIHVNEPMALDDERMITSDSQDSNSPSGNGFQVSPSPPAAHKVEPSSMLVKLEPLNLQCGQPLDFSVQHSPFSSTPGHSRADQPMDLSVKKRSPSPPRPSPSAAECNFLSPREQLARYLQTSALYEQLQRSQQTVDTGRDNNNNNNNTTIRKSWDMSADMPDHKPKEASRTSLLNKFRLSSPRSDSISDLASVSKILNNTGSTKFSMFRAEEDDVSVFKKGFMKAEPQMPYSLGNSPRDSPVSVKQENTESDVNILAQSYREEVPKTEQHLYRENVQKIEQQLYREKVLKGDIQGTEDDMRDDEFDEDEDEDEEEESEFMDDSSELMDGNKFDNDDETNGILETPTKKKRNSYADSPHKLNCPYCPRSFPWVSSLNRHLLTHTGQKPFKCPRCPVTFSTKSNRERHLIRKHGVNMLDPASRQTMDRPYKCHLCVFSSFSTESNLLKHYHERHQGIKPEPVIDDAMLMEGRDIMDNDDMDNSFSDDEPSLIPGKSLESIQTAESSLIESGSEQSQTDGSDYPPMTHFNNMAAAALDVQVGGHGAEDNDLDNDVLSERQTNPERDNYNVDKIKHCWKCAKVFPSRKMLVRHLKEHNIDLPYKCYLCDASYDLRRDCLQHQERFHGRDWCLLREKNGVDQIEGFAARIDQVVERHLRVGNGMAVEEQGEDDDVGGDEPIENVTSDYNQRKVYCSLCPKRFWSLQDLRRHMRSHTGERPFECNVCNKRFTLKHSMMRHRKKHIPGSESGALSDDDDSMTLDENITPGRGRSALRYHLTNMRRDSPVFPSERPSQGLNLKLKPVLTLDPESDDGILHNLLGVDESAINSMLDSAVSAAKMLGMNRPTENSSMPFKAPFHVEDESIDDTTLDENLAN